MFRVSLFGEDTPILKAVQEFAREYPDLARQSAFENIVPQIETMVNQQLKQRIPGPAKKPIKWTSDKQRKAYFATDGFGHGIPYKRTGKLPEAWEVLTRASEHGLRISVVNDNPAAPFVYGRWKQQFHTNTGWPSARPIIDRIADQARPLVFRDQLVLARTTLQSKFQRQRATLLQGRR